MSRSRRRSVSDGVRWSSSAIFQMAEVAVPRDLFARILDRMFSSFAVRAVAAAIRSPLAQRRRTFISVRLPFD
jgi:hypothetical protein